MSAVIKRRRLRRPPGPHDIIVSRMTSHALIKCKGCAAWQLMSAHDLRVLARALERVQAANAEGYCVWCSLPSPRAKRRREAARAVK